MNAIVYLSYTGQSLRIARHLHEETGLPLYDSKEAPLGPYGRLVFVFPVHCQALPAEAVRFLTGAQARELIPVATYGKMSYGGVLGQLQGLHPRIVGAACIPTKHAYLQADTAFADWHALAPLCRRICEENAEAIVLPMYKSSFWARLAPRLRSRLGVALRRTEACTQCGACRAACPVGAIQAGIPKSNCIRCLKCVAACPQKALQYRLRAPMRFYLRKERTKNLFLFL